MADKSRISNVLIYRNSLDRLATLSGPDQAQRACDEVTGSALCLDGLVEETMREFPVVMDMLRKSELSESDQDIAEPYRAPESDGA